MNAEAKVSLDASNFEAGTRRVNTATREVGTTSEREFQRVGDSAERAFEQAATGASRAGRSYRELASEAQRATRIIEQEARRAARVNHGSGSGAGSTRMRDQELSHVGRSLVDTIMAGQSPLRALEMEGPRLVQAFGGGLGTILGVGTAVAAMGAFVSKTAEAVTQANELKRAFNEALREGPLSGKEGPGAIQERVRELDEIIHKNGPATSVGARASRKMTDSLADLWEFTKGDLSHNPLNLREMGDRFGKADSGRDRRNMTRQAEDLRGQKLREIVSAQREENDLQERAYRSGQDGVRTDQVRLETRRKIAALEESMGLPKLRADYAQARNPRERASLNRELLDKEGSFMGQKEQIERGANLQIAADARRVSVAKENISLERELVTIKERGANVDAQSAQARLATALKILKNGPDSGPEYDANAARATSAGAEVRAAQRATAERREELGIRQAVSVLTEKADAAHLLALSLEEQKLRGRLASNAYGADAKAGFAQDLLDNKAAQRQAIEAGTQRADQGWLAGRAATYQRGYGGQEQSIRDRQTILNGQIEQNTIGTMGDGSRVFKNQNLGNEQLAQANELKRALEDIQDTRERELADAKQVTRETDMQSRGLRQSAADANTIFQLTQGIMAANRNNNAELASTKQAQLDIINAQIKLRNFLHPEGPATERAVQREHEGQQRASDMSAGLQHVTRDSNGTPLSGYDPATNSYRNTTPQERAAARAARRVGPYTGGTKAINAGGGGLIPDNADIPDNAGIADNQGMDFADLHHGSAFKSWRVNGPKPKSVAEQNRPNAPDKPKKPEAAPLEAKLEKLITSIEKVASKIAVAHVILFAGLAGLF